MQICNCEQSKNLHNMIVKECDCSKGLELKTDNNPIYPYEFVFDWICTCGRKHWTAVFAMEEGDYCGDSFNFTCECGKYYKKTSRIPSNTSSTYGWIRE